MIRNGDLFDRLIKDDEEEDFPSNLLPMSLMLQAISYDWYKQTILWQFTKILRMRVIIHQ